MPRTWIKLSKKTFNHNAQIIKQCAHNKTVAAVIKGNGYGHGLISMAQLCQQNKNIDWLCVAYLSEALNIRKHNITKPILVLSHIDDNLEHAINNNISFMLDSLTVAQQLEQVGKKHNYIFNVHIKVNTGLSRHGINANQIQTFIHKLKNYSNVTIEGIYSHFVQSHIENQTITNLQKQIFNYTIAQLKNKSSLLIHMSNSASLLTNTAPMSSNFFRVGLSLYGLWPSKYIQNKTNKKISLKPILEWKTKIQDIKEITSGTPIGYNHTFITTRNSHIAILPVGYADGINTKLSNCGYMIINNQRAPIVGKIAMNTCFIDVTYCSNAHIGQEVTIIGKEISAQDHADICKVGNVREILTAISLTD